MSLRIRTGVLLAALLGSAGICQGQTRDEMVREDRRKVTTEGFWIYNDLDRAFSEAAKTGKPLLVVLRCIPCEECVKLDDDLIDQDPQIRPLLDQFVCARQVSTNGLDLSLFQYDTDQSFAVFMLNADRTIYGRFGTRSHRTEWVGDVSLPGMAKALSGALALHAKYPSNREMLAKKQGDKPEFATPEQYPDLKEKFTDRLDYEGDVAKSCIHCHQIGDAQRSLYWKAGQAIPEKVLFPYPHPKTIGLILDSHERATVKQVTPESEAAAAGLESGDQILLIDGQPPLSIADIQWALHQIEPSGGSLSLLVRRDGELLKKEIELQAGWRQQGDISWRVTSWGLRRMVLGGMNLETLSDQRRTELGIPAGATALRVKNVGRYGPHATAKNAGVRPEDVLIGYDGQQDLKDETALFHYAITNKRPGDKVEVRLLRGSKTETVRFAIQP